MDAKVPRPPAIVPEWFFLLAFGLLGAGLYLANNISPPQSPPAPANVSGSGSDSEAWTYRVFVTVFWFLMLFSLGCRIVARQASDLPSGGTVRFLERVRRAIAYEVDDNDKPKEPAR